MKRAVLFCVLLAGCMSPEEMAAEVKTHNAAARTWCDTMGIRVTGVSCDWTGRCDIAPEGSTPFRLWCNSEGCRLPEPPAK